MVDVISAFGHFDPLAPPETDATASLGELISDRLHRILVQRIVTGVLKPGQRIDPGAIAAEFGISRAPVRDALKRIEFERLIETKARSGTFVTQPTIADVHEVCQLRRAMEWMAIGLATPVMPEALLRDLREEALAAQGAADAGEYTPFFRSDARLHRSIVAASGNARLVGVQVSFDPYISWLRVLGATGMHRLSASCRQHLAILDAMMRRDPAAAQTALVIHLEAVEQATVEDLQQCVPPASHAAPDRPGPDA